MPPGTNSENSSEQKPATVSQNEMLFMRGKAMSGAPIMIGTNQLPKPPIIAGHDHEEHHDQAVCRDQHVPHVALLVEACAIAAKEVHHMAKNLKARLGEFGTHDARDAATDNNRQ